LAWRIDRTDHEICGEYQTPENQLADARHELEGKVRERRLCTSAR
jgi:hypothetical protein